MVKTNIEEVTRANSKFASQFYDILSKEKPGENIFFSPLSAHTILSLLYQGSSGKTSESFSNTLQLSNKTAASDGYSNIITALNAVKNVTLLTANKIYVMDKFQINPDFHKVALEKFFCEAQNLNFVQNEESAKAINQWVEEKTNFKIKDLISPDCLDCDTRLVLVNAIYFKGNWVDPFDKNDTQVEAFYVTKNATIACQMMHCTRDYNYKHDDNLNAKVIEMPYENRDVRLIVVLPDAKDGIQDLEKKLVGVDLASITQGMYEQEVELRLPRFKISTDMDLENLLTKMGLGVIFDGNHADFTEIPVSRDKLFVSKAVQKAFIEVNEEGAEAAAATGLVCTLECYTEPTTFLADHPFIIVLQVKHQGFDIPLFVGKIQDPTLE